MGDVGDELEVDPAKMREAAGGINTATNTLQSQSAGFQQELGAQSDAFGTDDLGSLIAGFYQAIHELAFGSYDDNTGAMRGHVQGVHDLATAYETGEQANTGEMNDVRKILG
ncbi:hypothetical protein GCM10023195_38640 [Actinoallomurus liliacearum]|uniref:ESX-1 secretion-associated protein n=1 Tax=Actinoallomurus liliacearum TaxID=1080073 RepID=A0ABP8TJ70_9ACTN